MKVQYVEINIVVDGGDIIAIEFIQVIQRSDFDDRFKPHFGFC